MNLRAMCTASGPVDLFGRSDTPTHEMYWNELSRYPFICPALFLRCVHLENNHHDHREF